MHRRAAALLALLAAARAGPAAAGPDAGCGGDAFSSARVVEGRPPRHGPLTAVPDTLCADLAPRSAPVAIEIAPYVTPLPAPRVGGGGAGVPYEAGRRPERP